MLGPLAEHLRGALGAPSIPSVDRVGPRRSRGVRRNALSFRSNVHVPPVAGLVGLRPCFQSALVDAVSPGELSDGFEVVILP